MTVYDLIKNKDYDYISWRVKLDEEDRDKIGEDDIFFGVCCSKNGELISLDGDTYSENDKVLGHWEFSKPEKGIKNGLIILVE